MRSLKLFRALRWVMLPIGCLNLAIGLAELWSSFTLSAVVNLVVGVVVITTGILYLFVVAQLRRRLAEQDTGTPS